MRCWLGRVGLVFGGRGLFVRYLVAVAALLVPGLGSLLGCGLLVGFAVGGVGRLFLVPWECGVLSLLWGLGVLGLFGLGLRFFWLVVGLTRLGVGFLFGVGELPCFAGVL
ncbi:hypothetical protein GCM10022254_08030 [Actinomadura meridiana]|uniref:Uncharacterized protein n=1 Tax=Actinomadura meridiana TaxID=559626 RepID=A0ABP8BTA7_9ACTN